MIGRLNHVAIAVRDIAKAAAVYRDALGAAVSGAVAQPEYGVGAASAITSAALEQAVPISAGFTARASWLIHPPGDKTATAS
jgi:catechol 2,3-dioxygenase-like lactoylglutathione lyase family enzyme